MWSPDEIFWSTLNARMVNVMFASPGGYDGPADRKPWLSKYAAWSGQDPCHGKFVRSVCVFGVGDLPNLISRKEFFANKFYIQNDYLVLDCLEEWLYNRSSNWDRQPMDLQYYRNLPFVIRS